MNIPRVISRLLRPLLEPAGDFLFTYDKVRGIRVLNAQKSGDPDYAEQVVKTMSLALDIIDDYDCQLTKRIQDSVRRVVVIDERHQYMEPERGSYWSDLRYAAKDPWVMASHLVWVGEYFLIHTELDAKKRASQRRLAFLQESGAPEAVFEMVKKHDPHSDVD